MEPFSIALFNKEPFKDLAFLHLLTNVIFNNDIFSVHYLNRYMEVQGNTLLIKFNLK